MMEVSPASALDALMGKACVCLSRMEEALSAIRGVIRHVRGTYGGVPGSHHLPEIERHAKEGAKQISLALRAVQEWDDEHETLELVWQANLEDESNFPLDPGVYRTWTEAVFGCGALAGGIANELWDTLNSVAAYAEPHEGRTEEQRFSKVRSILRPWRKLTREFASQWNRRIQLECGRAIRDVNRDPGQTWAPVNETIRIAQIDNGTGPIVEAPPAIKSKRSTVRGEGQAKLAAALTQHHQYAKGGCLNLDPIGNNELARMAGVGKQTASRFFKKEFDGHGAYQRTCMDQSRLVVALKTLNGEYRPRDFLDVRHPDDMERGDD